jgi:UDP-N-acetylglucosamine 2-epimerase (non-hydrolysing)
MKLMTILGTRPEIIKLAETIKECDKYLDHILVHTGQNFDYELNEVFFRNLELRRPDYFLDAAAETAAGTIANVIEKSNAVMEKERPDAVLIYGDTNSSLACIPAKRRHIPLFHMEAGNRSFDQRVPEEINRRIVDHLADINMVLTEHSRRYLEREGIPPERIIKTGSSMKEVFEKYKQKIDGSNILDMMRLDEKKYFVASSHREEVVDDPGYLADLLESFNALIETYGYPVVFSVHPRTQKRLEAAKLELNEKIIFSKPFGFFDYIALQQRAFCVLSDSGTITEESSILGFPAVTTRVAHERPEGNDEGTLVMCGYEKNRVLKAVEVVVSQAANRVPYIIKDYEADNVSQKVLRSILSFTPYINELVWRKQ